MSPAHEDAPNAEPSAGPAPTPEQPPAGPAPAHEEPPGGPAPAHGEPAAGPAPGWAATPGPGAGPTPVWASPGPPPAGAAAAPRSSRLKLGIVAAVSAVIVVGGGVAVAQAASDGTTQDGRGPGGARGAYGLPGGNGAPGAPGAGQPGNGAQGNGIPGNGIPGNGGRGGIGALGGALHGDFVVKNDGGQYVTQRLQSGTVTAVSATSITAKSEDGHSTTYVVGADSKVNNGAAKISDVKTGDTVTVVGVVSGDTATATVVSDTTLLRQGNGGNGQRPGATPRPTRTT